LPRYFIAILPPTNISHDVLSFQQQIEQEFQAVHAQKVPPHITIIPPFESDKEKLELFIHKLNVFLNEQKEQAIEIQLSGFQHFANRTLFVDVAKNVAFETFCKALKLLFNQQKIIKQRAEKHFFIPHLTIANKDLKKRDFKTAWEYFKKVNYEGSFKLNAISILQHDGEKWNTFKSINFDK
jgi:2'-5' RNA ligase